MAAPDLYNPASDRQSILVSMFKIFAYQDAYEKLADGGTPKDIVFTDQALEDIKNSSQPISALRLHAKEIIQQTSSFLTRNQATLIAYQYKKLVWGERAITAQDAFEKTKALVELYKDNGWSEEVEQSKQETILMDEAERLYEAEQQFSRSLLSQGFAPEQIERALPIVRCFEIE
jgi:hypothetical protein